jgi:hypothetical protein
LPKTSVLVTLGTSYETEVLEIPGEQTNAASHAVGLHWLSIWLMSVAGGLTAKGDVTPVNDNFSQATLLSGTSGSYYSHSFEVATYELGEEQSPNLGSVWFRWTAPATAMAVFQGSSGPVQITTGTALNALSVLDGVEYSKGGYTVRAGVTKGVTYNIRGLLHPYSVVFLDWAVGDSPSNDNFVDAIALNPSGDIQKGDTSLATAEWGEPEAPNTVVGMSVWYSVTLPENGLYGFQLQNDSGYPYRISLYSGESVSGLTPLLGDYGQALSINAGSGDLILSGTAGQAIKIKVDVDAQAYYFLPGTFELKFEKIARPENDDFAHAQVIEGYSGSIDSAVTGGSLEPGESDLPGVNTTDSTVWYSWTPPVTGVYSFGVRAQYAEGVRLAIYSGTSLASLSPKDGDFNPSWQLNVSAGEPIAIAVRAPRTVESPFTLTWSELSPPWNYYIANAAELGDWPYSGGNFGAPGGWNLWFKFTAPKTGAFLFQDYNNHNLILYTGTGSEPSQLQKIQGTRWDGVRTSLAEGETCYLELTGFPGWFTITWKEVPLNDEPSGAQLISGTSGSVLGDNTNGTNVNDPYQSGSGYRATGAAVWYRWVCPADGIYTFTTTAWVGTVNTIYKLTSNAPSGSYLIPLADVGDVAYLQTQVNAQQLSLVDWPVGMALTARDILYISVDTVDTRFSSAGAFTLTWQLHPLPANDSFSHPVVLTGTQGKITADNVSATNEKGEPSISAGADGGTLWYSFTPAQDSVLILQSSVRALEWAAYTGTSIGSLTCVQRNDSGDDPFRCHCHAGQTYFVQTDSFGSHKGDRSFDWELVPAAKNDLKADAQRLAPEHGKLVGSTANASSDPDEAPYSPTVWYRWKAPANGMLVVRVNDVAQPATWSPGVVFPNEIADFPHKPKNVGFRYVSAGSVLYFAVRGNYGQTGDFNLRWNFFSPPINENISSAQHLEGREGSVAGTTAAAPALAYSQFEAPSLRLATVWYEWTPEETMPYAFSINLPDPALIKVFKLDNGQLKPVATQIGGGNFYKVFMSAKASTKYYISVAGAMGDVRQFNLSWKIVNAVGFEFPYVRVSRDIGSAPITLVRRGDLQTPVSVTYYTDGFNSYFYGAWYDWDYTNVYRTILFPPGVSRRTVRVPILRPRESVRDLCYFKGFVYTNSGNTMTDFDTTIVGICSERADGVFEFKNEATPVNESAGVVTVTVQQVGPGQQAHSINYECLDGSAVSGSDYTKLSGSLFFAAGQKTADITILINHRSGFSGARAFNVALKAAESGVSVGVVNLNHVTILDSDNAAGVVELSQPMVVAHVSNLTCPVTLTRKGGQKGIITATVKVSPHQQSQNSQGRHTFFGTYTKYRIPKENEDSWEGGTSETINMGMLETATAIKVASNNELGSGTQSGEAVHHLPIASEVKYNSLWQLEKHTTYRTVTFIPGQTTADIVFWLGDQRVGIDSQSFDLEVTDVSSPGSLGTQTRSVLKIQQ